jgi:hypothetical protein
LGGAGLKAEEGEGEVAAMVVELSGEVVGFWFATLPYRRGLWFPMVDVVGEGVLIVEEFRVHRPCAIRIPETIADEVAFELRHGVAEQHTLVFLISTDYNPAQALVWGGEGAIVRWGGRGKPAFVNAAAGAA